MGSFLQEFKSFLRKGDMILLLLCLVTNAFGCLIIASATNAEGTMRYVIIQVLAALLGVLLYAITSSVDVDFFSENRMALIIFNTFLLLLLIPFGTDNGTGNKSWLNFPFLPVDIQPAELCKITFILIMASVMASHQNNISSFSSVGRMLLQVGLLVGLNMVLSHDMGVSLIFVFIFVGMALTGGVSYLWFLAAGGGIAVFWPIFYSKILGDYQRNRIDVLFNPDLDAQGIGARYHTVRSLKSLTGGGLTGQGLFQGTRTQSFEALYAQHTDFIFSAIGEELGYLGCLLVLVLLVSIIARCLWVGTKSQDYMRRLICFGAASALIFQVMSNIGMCIGVAPVIGLTLPFISYGGSSLVSLYAMLGLVSGVHARPSATSHERYIRPYR